MQFGSRYLNDSASRCEWHGAACGVHVAVVGHRHRYRPRRRRQRRRRRPHHQHHHHRFHNLFSRPLRYRGRRHLLHPFQPLCATHVHMQKSHPPDSSLLVPILKHGFEGGEGELVSHFSALVPFTIGYTRALYTLYTQ